MENLLAAWEEFLRGKRHRKDVAAFGLRLTDHVIALHRDLAAKTYRHGSYQPFKVRDPKPRDIHKASVRDRLLHHAIYRVLYPEFDRKFIYDSYSCRRGKGTHRAINRFREFARKVSRNHTRTVWVLQCDIRKFFANIDHEVLYRILERHTADEDLIWLLKEVVGSFHTDGRISVGLPLGNLTSQLLVNIYMNDFDHFMKRVVKAKCYIRYADDFVILHEDKGYLERLIPTVAEFLDTKLKLSLHPDKVFIKTLGAGIDFLGWVHFPKHRVLRTTTKRRMLGRVNSESSEAIAASYLGILNHGDTYRLQQKVVK